MYLMAYTAKQSQPTILIRNLSYLSLCCYVEQDDNGNGEYKKSYIQTEPVPQDGFDQWLRPIKPEKLDSAGFAEDFSLHYKSVRLKSGERRWEKASFFNLERNKICSVIKKKASECFSDTKVYWTDHWQG